MKIINQIDEYINNFDSETKQSKVSPSGVIIANYERAGDVKTGSF